MAEQGFVIADRVYPFPEAFRMCDPVLVADVTGMTWHEFTELLDDTDRPDPAAMAGMLAVAVWQGNPRWARDRVVRFVENLQMDSVEVRGADEPDDAGPPAPSEPPTPLSPDPSTRSSDETSPPSATPGSFGEQESDTTSPESE